MNNYGQERGHTMAQGKAKAAKKTLMFFFWTKHFFGTQILFKSFFQSQKLKKKSEPKYYIWAQTFFGLTILLDPPPKKNFTPRMFFRPNIFSNINLTQNSFGPKNSSDP